MNPISTQEIKTIVSLKPSEINKEYLLRIHDKIKKIEGTCDKDNGYIISVDYDTIKITDNYIDNYTCNVRVHLSLDVNTILPKKDDIYVGSIKTVQSYGYFVSIIPDEKDEDLELKDEDESLNTQDKDKIIIFVKNDCKSKEKKINTKVKVKINSVKYDNQKFSCIGEFVNSSK